jgi:hypothetical protein
LINPEGTFMQRISHPKRLLAGSIGVIAIGAMVIAAAGVGASTGANSANKVVRHARPQASVSRRTAGPATAVPVTAFHQEFGTNLQYFCPANSGNAPCDGNSVTASDYGTIDRVSSGFSNGGYGNYAPSTPSLVGNWMALVSGTADGNQGAGCAGTTASSNPGEACTGPYALFGSGANEGAENVFPTHGFTVTNDLYLSPATAAPIGSLVDDDIGLNNSSGGYGIDNIITACLVSGGFVINFGNGSPGSCSGSPVITSAGWYRFVFQFSNSGGNAELTETVLSENTSDLADPTVVATSGAQPVGGTASPISSWGGPGYFWLPTEDFSGLPLANFALQLGQQAYGYTP